MRGERTPQDAGRPFGVAVAKRSSFEKIPSCSVSVHTAKKWRYGYGSSHVRPHRTAEDWGFLIPLTNLSVGQVAVSQKTSP